MGYIGDDILPISMGIKDLYGGYRDNVGITNTTHLCGDYVDYKEYIGIIGTI